MSQFKQNEYMIWRPGEFLIELNTLVPNYAEVLRAYKKHKKQGNRGYVLNQEWDHVYQPALVNLMQSLCHIFWAGQGLLLQHKGYSCSTSHFQLWEARVSAARRKQNDVGDTSMTQAEGEGVTQSPFLFILNLFA